MAQGRNIKTGSTDSAAAPTLQTVFGDAVLGWGAKYKRDEKLFDIWSRDHDYLIWACNLAPSRNPCASPPPLLQQLLVKIAFKIEQGDARGAAADFQQLDRWRQISLHGIGLSALPRPSPDQCLDILERSSLLAGHRDLDGLYSLAAVLAYAHALGFHPGKGDSSVPFRKFRLLNYGFRNLDDYSASLAMQTADVLVVIDFSAHPGAALNLDHHTTSLRYWSPEQEIPRGIYDPDMPSCPRLLATHCGLELDDDVLSGRDRIDGALYSSVEEAHDLTDPFVALSYALDVDVSEVVAKKVVLTLAENDLDPYAVPHDESWEARVRLVECEMNEQRRYWNKKNRVALRGTHVALADAQSAPHNSTRFRYLPFELEGAGDRPYLITLRSTGSPDKMSIGFGRNPFFAKPEFFTQHELDVGILLQSLGSGGGRREVGSLRISRDELQSVLQTIERAIEESVVRSE